MTATGKWAQGVQMLRSAATQTARGFFEITHNSVALIGLIVLFATLTVATQPQLRQAGERKLALWLHERQASAEGDDLAAAAPEAIDRATAANPKDLPKTQAVLAYWLSKKYKVAPEPVSALVAEAFELGQRTRLDPTLLLAVMAVESGFNPFAQSPVGAQGLMQVMTRVHSDKYENFGGSYAAFDPVANLRVGAKVLQDCITRAGSIELGLKHYVGAGNTGEDGGYAAKVLAEQARLKSLSLVARQTRS